MSSLQSARPASEERADAVLFLSYAQGDDESYLEEFFRYLLAEIRAVDAPYLYFTARYFTVDDPYTLMAVNNLAICLRLVGEFPAATALDEVTVLRRREVLGEKHPFTLAAVVNLAICLHAMRDYRDAPVTPCRRTHPGGPRRSVGVLRAGARGAWLLGRYRSTRSSKPLSFMC
jgi:hypothetical protein